MFLDQPSLHNRTGQRAPEYLQLLELLLAGFHLRVAQRLLPQLLLQEHHFERGRRGRLLRDSGPDRLPLGAELEGVEVALEGRALADVGELVALEVLHDLDALPAEVELRAFEPLLGLGALLALLRLLPQLHLVLDLLLVLDVLGSQLEGVLDLDPQVLLEPLDGVEHPEDVVEGVFLYFLVGGLEGVVHHAALVGDGVDEDGDEAHEFDEREDDQQEEEGEELDEDVAVQDDQGHCQQRVPDQVLRHVHQLQDLPGLPQPLVLSPQAALRRRGDIVESAARVDGDHGRVGGQVEDVGQRAHEQVPEDAELAEEAGVDEHREDDDEERSPEEVPQGVDEEESVAGQDALDCLEVALPEV